MNILKIIIISMILTFGMPTTHADHVNQSIAIQFLEDNIFVQNESIGIILWCEEQNDVIYVEWPANDTAVFNLSFITHQNSYITLNTNASPGWWNITIREVDNQFSLRRWFYIEPKYNLSQRLNLTQNEGDIMNFGLLGIGIAILALVYAYLAVHYKEGEWGRYAQVSLLGACFLTATIVGLMLHSVNNTNQEAYLIPFYIFWIGSFICMIWVLKNALEILGKKKENESPYDEIKSYRR